jgi:hypothetical protein
LFSFSVFFFPPLWLLLLFFFLLGGRGHPNDFLGQKFIILQSKKKSQATWSMELLGKIPEMSSHFQDLFFLYCQDFCRIWADF